VTFVAPPQRQIIQGQARVPAKSPAGRSPLARKVIAIIAETLAQPESSIAESKHFLEDLGADSLDMVEIMMAAEENLGVAIPENVQERIRTVGDAIDYLEKVRS